MQKEQLRVVIEFEGEGGLHGFQRGPPLKAKAGFCLDGVHMVTGIAMSSFCALRQTET